MAEKVLVLCWAEEGKAQLKFTPDKSWSIAIAGPQASTWATDLIAKGHQVLTWPNFAPTFSALLSAGQALVQKLHPTIILASDESPWANILPALSLVTQGIADTKLDQLKFEANGVKGQRGYFRQRLNGTLSRAARPWLISLNGAAQIDISPEAGFEGVSLETSDLPAPAASTRTVITGEEALGGAVQTLRPQAAMLVVAGAGLCKPQADGASHVAEAEQLVLALCDKLQASLGSTKSLVDQSGEGQATMACLTHLHQIGQTGQTPHHQAGIAIGCHGEAPHVVGWRFIPHRLAINLDPQCGWVNEADYLYVADAFKLLPLVLARL